MTVFWFAVMVKVTELEKAGIVTDDGMVSADGLELETATIVGWLDTLTVATVASVVAPSLICEGDNASDSAATSVLITSTCVVAERKPTAWAEIATDALESTIPSSSTVAVNGAEGAPAGMVTLAGTSK